MRLHHGDDLIVGRGARRLQHGGDLHRVMAIVVEDGDAPPFTRAGEAALDAAEAGERSPDLLRRDVELVRNRATREPLAPFNGSSEPMSRLVGAAMERGLYLFVHWNVVVICPPLTITREELDEGLAVLDEALAIADEYVV